MATQRQLRRGTTTQHSTFTGALAEVTVDTTKDTAVVHDAVTAGGYPLAREDLNNVSEIPVSKLADGAARQLLQTAANGTDVEWTSNVDVPGTLDVTGAATFDSSVTVTGDLTVNGTTTTINSTVVSVDDKLIELGSTASPTDVGADQGGILLKGTTDKSIKWIDSTDAWTSSEHVDLASGKAFYINGTQVLSATALGSNVLITSANITDGTIVDADISASAAIAGSKLQAGTTSNAGALQLTDSTSSTSATTAATPNSVKSAYDLANAAMPKAGGTFTGDVTFNSGNVVLQAGSASTPALQPSGDPNTGIFFPAADTIAFAEGGAEAARIDSSGRLLVGTSSARSNFFNSTLSAAFQIEGVGTGRRAAIIGDDGTAFFILAKQNSGAVGGNTIVANQDAIGEISFQGNDGTEFVEAAAIQCVVDGTPGANDMPGRLVFSTTADGASSPTERMRIDNAGILFSTPTYNDTTATAANVVVASTGRLSRSTSSIKYKTDVETLQDCYADLILNCRPVWYRSTTGNDNPDWGWWGFIAEEVAEIDPRLVHWKTSETSYNDKGAVVQTPLEAPEPEGVQYDRFVPHLLNLIKRQKEQIEAMEARLSALEAA